MSGVFAAGVRGSVSGGSLCLRLLACLLCAGLMEAQTTASLSGQVINENNSPVPGGRVLLRSHAASPPVLPQVFTDLLGRFRLENVGTGEFLVTIEHEGYYAIRDKAVVLKEGINEVILTLVREREDYERIEVVAPAPAVDMDNASSPEVLSGKVIVDVPVPNTNDLRSSLRILPGVTRDNRGGLHIHGGSEDQVMYTLNGFNVTDPLTGRFETRLSVESVQTVEVASGNLAAEYGKGSAGTLTVNTRSGDDKLRYSATNFIPGIESSKGVYLGNWTPRVNFSGPVARGRAWFSDSADAQYVQNVVRDLPRGEDRTSAWRYSNFLTGQVNLTASQILHTGFLVNVFTAPRTGLSALEPMEATIDRRRRQYFFYVKDQIYLTSKALLEIGFATNRTFGREIPQGHGLYELTAYGRGGNYYVDAVRKSARDQITANGFLPAFERWGHHQVKAGLDLNRLNYWQDVRRTGYLNFSERGSLLRRTVFGGSGLLERSNYETALFLQDSWRVRPSLLLELGVRADWDQILQRWDAGPRLGFAWSPPGLESTKFFGGFARLFDATNLRIFTRPMDQYAMTTYFDDTGAVGRGPALSVFQIFNPRLHRPRYHNWSLGAERQWTASFSTRLEVLRRRGGDGFSYVNLVERKGAPPELTDVYPCPAIDAVYNLTNERTDAYDSVALSLRHNIRRQYEWMASYTWSQALSNTVVDINVDDPLIATDNRGRMPWDSPHRFLSWGYLPTFWKNWAVAYLVEARTGYPFNVMAEDGRLVGGPSSRRYPTYLELNLHLERQFAFAKYRWALRFGSNNITGRINPDAVNNIATSSRFLTYYGGTGRSFNFRIRWLGRL